MNFEGSRWVISGGEGDGDFPRCIFINYGGSRCEICNKSLSPLRENLAALGTEQQVQQLLRMIDDMVKKNGGTCYTNEMYKEAEKAMRRREKTIRDEMEQKKRDEIERIELQIAMRLSEVQGRYQQMMNDMQVRMRELQASQSRGDERAGLSDELKSLKKRLDQMTKEKEQEKQQLKENTRKVEELEAKYQKLEDKYRKLKDTTRTLARKEVEGEAEGFGFKWRGIRLDKALEKFFS